ncbi:MAG: type II toxin-antitoxin system HigB family toxin [Isosphaerales bacterium]
MHVISKKTLRDFWADYPDAESPLRSWLKAARRVDWKNFAEVHGTFPKADRVGKLTVFNIAGNKYRLIAAIHHNRGKIYIRHVLTHAEYDRGTWKED